MIYPFSQKFSTLFYNLKPFPKWPENGNTRHNPPLLICKLINLQDSNPGVNTNVYIIRVYRAEPQRYVIGMTKNLNRPFHTR